MRCPHCKANAQRSRVKQTRAGRRRDGGIERDRECKTCKTRWKTVEHIERTTVSVLKRSGEYELFDPRKVEASVQAAARKRGVEKDVLRTVLDEAERTAYTSPTRAVASDQIAQVVVRTLARLDPTTALRYLLVGKGLEFEDTAVALAAIRTMQHEAKQDH